eukprot:2700983-Prorocentrum_lima.AAC.1
MAERGKRGEKLGLLGVGDERDGLVERHGAEVGGQAQEACAIGVERFCELGLRGSVAGGERGGVA